MFSQDFLKEIRCFQLVDTDCYLSDGYQVYRYNLKTKKHFLVTEIDHDSFVVSPDATMILFTSETLHVHILGGDTVELAVKGVVKSMWHPMSQTHLLVLKQTGLVMYNVQASLSEPESVWNLSQKSGFSPFDESCVSFVLGKQDWGLLTCYCLLGSGDIISVCPVLPLESTVEHDYLQRLYAQTYCIWKESNNAQQYWTLDWLQKAIKQHTDQKSPTYCFVSPPFRHSIARVGPYLMEPTEAAKSISDVLDLLVVQSNDCPLLLLGTDKGVCVCLMPDDIQRLWVLDPDQEPEMPGLVILEMIELSETKTIKFYQHEGDRMVYCTTDAGLYQIDIQTSEQEWIPSVVRRLYATSEEITGFDIVNDVSLGYFYVLCLKNGTIVSQDIVIPTKRSKSNVQVPVVPFKALETMQLSMTRTKPVISGKYPDFVNQETLTKIVKHFAELRDNVKLIYNVHGELEEHLDAQRETIDKLHSFLDNAQTRIQQVSQKNQKAKTRIADQIAKQQELNKRSLHILTTLFELSQPTLSIKETQFIQQLASIQVLLQDIEKQPLPSTKIKSQPQALGSGQLMNIKQQLKSEFTELSDLMTRVKQLQRQLGIESVP
ncbi:hypothetical protein EDD86DRAFT_212341 [Gorgonomyces haynaldii]|nr:hypothetical protein EDD86DRAFT_212341 [Gorgonomyces haynaldii]